MNIIMLSVVEKGTHAYRPSTQSQGLVPSLANPDDSNDISEESGTELQPNLPSSATSPPTFPSPSPSASATAFISNNSILSSLAPSASASNSTSLSAAVSVISSGSGKQKHSAVDDGTHLSAPPSQAGSRGKSRISAGAMALLGIKDEIESFNETLRERGQNRPLTESQRKTKAMEMLQEIELDDDRLIAIMEVFKKDVDAADMFVSMKRESTRLTWVKAELARLGFDTNKSNS